MLSLLIYSYTHSHSHSAFITFTATIFLFYLRFHFPWIFDCGRGCAHAQTRMPSQMSQFSSRYCMNVYFIFFCCYHFTELAIEIVCTMVILMLLQNWNTISVSFQFPFWQIWIGRNLLLEIKCLILLEHALIKFHLGQANTYYSVFELQIFVLIGEQWIWTPKKQQRKKTKFIRIMT